MWLLGCAGDPRAWILALQEEEAVVGAGPDVRGPQHAPCVLSALCSICFHALGLFCTAPPLAHLICSFPVLYGRTSPVEPLLQPQEPGSQVPRQFPKVEDYSVPILLCYQPKTMAKQRKPLLQSSVFQFQACPSGGL